MKVLIVEDEAILAMNIRIELSSAGNTVVGVADSADRALQIAGKDRPDVVLMDIVLQGETSGIELTRIFADRYPEVKVIYMTAHSDETTLNNAKQTPHAGFLNKPFEVHQLVRALRQVMESKQ